MSMPPPPPPGQPQQPAAPGYPPAAPGYAPTPGYAPAPGYQPAPGYAQGMPPAPPAGGKPKWLVPLVILLAVAIGAGVAWKVSSGDDDKKSSDDVDITIDFGGTDPTITQPTNNGEGYTPEIRATFVDGCVSTGGTVTACNCVYDEIVRTIPFSDFLILDQQAADDSSALDDPRVSAAISACI